MAERGSQRWMQVQLDEEAFAREIARNNFPDVRLTTRLETTARSVARAPQKSLPKALTPAALEGAYRFFSNHRVTPKLILGPHFESTKQRAAAERGCVRVIHDTTEFGYRRDGKRKGLGNRAYQGFCGHFSLVVSGDEARRPLGLAGLHTWSRGETTETEQSYWLQQIEASAALLDSGTKPIHICDRGAADYVLFHDLLERGHRFVIRNAAKRFTLNGPESTKLLLRDALATVEHVAKRTARLNPRPENSSEHRRKIHPPRKARKATLHVAATTIRLARPSMSKKSDRGALLSALPESLSLNVVRVWEPSPPEGEEPIEWFLFTNESIATAEDVVAIVDHYRARWTVEEYFKALKTGCAFEQRQLEDYESLTNALAVFAVLAYQILLLRTLARQQPEAPAATVATSDQLEVLRSPLARRKLPPDPTARDVLLAIAALGGHIQYAPDPGWLTIARGYETLDAYVLAWRAAKSQFHSDQR